MQIRPGKILISSLLTLVLFTMPQVAFAEDEQDSEASRQKAAEYYQEAAELYMDGQFDRAAELLGLAYEHDPNLVYRYNQILAYQGLGDYEGALDLLAEYEEAMGEVEGFDDIAEIREELEEVIAAIEAEAARAEEAERAEKEEVEIIDEPRQAESSNTLAWALVGTGGATLAGGLLLSSGMLIGDEIDRLEGSRTPSAEEEVYGTTSFDRQDDLDTLRTHQMLSVVLLSGGALLTATGSVMLMRSGGADPAMEESSSLRMQPAVGSSGVGAQIMGRF